MAKQGNRLDEIRVRPQINSAILFLHGFSGDKDETWDRFTWILKAEESLDKWDILSLGYSTSLGPDIKGIWSADPDLPILSLHFRTRMKANDSLAKYSSLVIVAHSMGGLIVQRALIDDSNLADRTKGLFLFGTPSDGLVKASFFSFLKPQFKNMSHDSEFIKNLRRDWKDTYGNGTHFKFLSIAGDKDQFVPSWSSLNPFPESVRRVVEGNHLSMVKPENDSSESVQLLLSSLVDAKPEPKGPSTLARLDEATVVNKALKLDRVGRREEAIGILKEQLGLGTDVKGTLAGRIKRVWLDTGDPADAKLALELYRTALESAQAESNHDQIFYQAINVAFMEFVANNNQEKAQEFAQIALDACEASGQETEWSVGTQAEAMLYLGKTERALDLYKKALTFNPELWQAASMGQQAFQIANKLGDSQLAESLELLFNPESRQFNKVFISYSHKDVEWREKLRTQLALYLRKGELELWDDSKVRAGQEWNEEINQALRSSAIVVPLVSANFFDSDFIWNHELPLFIQWAKKKDIKLMWVHVSASTVEDSDLWKFQAAHKPPDPLDAFDKSSQAAKLKEIAQNIRLAVYD